MSRYLIVKEIQLYLRLSSSHLMTFVPAPGKVEQRSIASQVAADSIVPYRSSTFGFNGCSVFIFWKIRMSVISNQSIHMDDIFMGHMIADGRQRIPNRIRRSSRSSSSLLRPFFVISSFSTSYKASEGGGLLCGGAKFLIRNPAVSKTSLVG